MASDFALHAIEVHTSNQNVLEMRKEDGFWSPREEAAAVLQLRSTANRG